MKRIFAIVLALTLCATTVMFSGCGVKKDTEKKDESKKTFVMGIDPEYPPFSYMDENGEYTGFDVEVCKAACEYLDWDFKVFGVNWDNKLVQLDSNECDCVWSGMTILPSMKEKGYVISRPYFDNKQVLVVKEDSAFKSSKDLAKKDVAVMLGTSGESLLKEDLKTLQIHSTRLLPAKASLSASQSFRATQLTLFSLIIR
ncbi:MAG: transporter substrate-binding domain-containing protein [Ruminococcus sp.]|nr:transporter substrate-binding domain-containing protein [Candidatus Copronaster equi]